MEVGLLGLGGVGADRLQVVTQREQVVEQRLGLDRVGVHDVLLELGDALGRRADQLLLDVEHLDTDGRDDLDGRHRAEAVGVQPPADHGQLTVGRLHGERIMGRPEHRDEQMEVEEDLQRLEMQPPIGPSGQPVDGAEQVVGVHVQLGDGRAREALLQVGRLDPDEVGEQRHPLLVGVVKVDPDDAVLPGDDLPDLAHRQCHRSGARDPANLHDASRTRPGCAPAPSYEGSGQGRRRWLLARVTAASRVARRRSLVQPLGR